MKKLPLTYYQNNTSLKILKEEGRYLIVQNKYGKLKIFKPHLLKGVIPTIRTAINKTSYCINQFKEKHKDKYNYKSVDYKNDSTEVTITCKEHGDFEQTPNSHKSGSGCFKCGVSRNNSIYSLSRACKNKNKWQKEKSGLYILQLTGCNEKFTKIGISNNIKDRIRHITAQSGYKVEILAYSEMSLYEAVIIENFYLTNKCNLKYTPINKFSGRTECILTKADLDYLGESFVTSNNFIKRIEINEF